MKLTIALAIALSIAAADEPLVEEARELYRAGSEAYRQGQYVVAINAFEAALAKAAKPPVIFALAQSYRLQYFVDGDPKKLERAVELYRQYLAHPEGGTRRQDSGELLATLVPIYERLQREVAPKPTEPGSEPISPGRVIVSSRVEGATARIDGGDPQKIPAAFEVKPGEHRVVVEAPLHQAKTMETVAIAAGVVALNVELDEIPGALMIRAPSGAQVNVDGRTVGVAPLAEPLEVGSGRHLVSVTDRGYEPFVQQIELGRGQAVELEADMKITSQRIVSYALFAGSAVLLAGTAIAAGYAIDTESGAAPIEAKLDAKQSVRPEEVDEYNRLRDRRDDYVLLGAAAAVAGVGAAVTGVFVWLFDEPDAPRAPVLAPIQGGGAQASAGFRF